MYIDFHKYNYSLVENAKKPGFITRDQAAYKEVLKKWFETNIDTFVQRKWEIDEILYLSEISDFIKLLREGEQLYEFGFFTSCIALIGMSAEDFTKYLAIKLGKPTYESLTQFIRLRSLRNDGLITDPIFNSLDNIRLIRNDCLHFDQAFKQKTEDELKQDALTVLNDLKNTLRSILGISANPIEKVIIDVIEDIAIGEDVRNLDEVASKLKNAVSHLLEFPIAFPPEEKFRVQYGYFRIDEIDFEGNETTFIDLRSELPVILELPERHKELFERLKLTEGMIVFGVIFSIIDTNGLTAEWNIMSLKSLT